ncbi:glycosyltransferase family 2 protein [uncultured Aquabacterium sp.]|jgi:glycosyltransferase involved in cell wall biosynthesis|uniref:glycosyltransferase family 2 protein n=1 Tax=uncultured Aquabacterium sp. TaxID=158753 RepID=UPI00262BA284|nr:glycosyltransferase family 2 protein [uncultured Aquabacterium sp.]
MRMLPHVSIIMPAYNAARTILESIRSAQAQDFEDWELLVIDDGSRDETVKIVCLAREADARIKLLRTGGRTGAAQARTTGIQEARGRYIAFLDSDDVWLPNKLSLQLSLFQATGCNFSYGAYRKMDDDSVVGSAVIQVPATLSYREILKSNQIGCLTAMYDSHFFGRVCIPSLGRANDHGLWRHLLGGQVIHEDYGLWLSLLKRPGAMARGIQEPLAHYRIGRNTRSSNKIAAAASQWLIYRRLEQLGRFRSAYYFVHYAIRGVAKYLQH